VPGERLRSVKNAGQGRTLRVLKKKPIKKNCYKTALFWKTKDFQEGYWKYARSGQGMCPKNAKKILISGYFNDIS